MRSRCFCRLVIRGIAICETVRHDEIDDVSRRESLKLVNRLLARREWQFERRRARRRADSADRRARFQLRTKFQPQEKIIPARGRLRAFHDQIRKIAGDSSRFQMPPAQQHYELRRQPQGRLPQYWSHWRARTSGVASRRKHKKKGATSLAPDFAGRFCEYQCPKRFRHVKIWRRGIRRTPRGIKTRFRSPFHPKEIHSPHCRHLETRSQTLHRQRHDPTPLFRMLIDIHTSPQAAPQITLFSGSNLQIKPQSIRRQFDFFVTASMRAARLQEHFANIAIPKPISPSRRFRIRKNADAPEPRVKSHKQKLRIPQQPHLRFPLSIHVIALPVRAKANGRSRLPSTLRRKSFSVNRADHTNRKGGICSDVSHT